MLQPIIYFMVSMNMMKYPCFTACSLEMNFYLGRIIVCLLTLRFLKGSGSLSRGFETVNLQPVCEAEMHAFHRKQSHFWSWTEWFDALEALWVSSLAVK